MFIRNCPECEKVLYYKSKRNLEKSALSNKLCRQCSHKGKIVSEQRKESLRQKMLGSKNHFFGKTHTQETKDLISSKTKGKIISEEHKKIMSKTHKGYPLSAEHKAKISAASIGRIVSEETKSKQRNKIVSEETRKKISQSWKTRKISQLTKNKIHKIFANKRIENGITFITRRQYGHWAFQVRKRDNFTCQTCSSITELNAHHIKLKSEYPLLALEISNGITLCKKCHKRIHDQIRLTKKLEKPIVLVTGTFHALHPGHLELFEYSSQFGNLIVGINGDSYLLQKSNKIVIPLEDRIYSISCNKFVSHVFVFFENDPSELIKLLRPQYFVKGPDYAGKTIPEEEICKLVGTQYITAPQVKKFNTSDLLNLKKD